ncbi:hypothetical protein AMTRI_Chr03g46560 [Amborella trichopoda]
MVYQAPIKKRKNGLILRRKNTYYKRKKITSSFSLSKISSTISSCLFKSCSSLKNTQITTSRALIRVSFSKISKIRSTISSCLSKSCLSSGFLFLYKSNDRKICPILVKVSFPPLIQSNEVQWFPYSSPVLSFFNTLYERAGAFYITHFTEMRTTKIIYSKDHSVLVHENIIGIIVKLPFYFMLLGLLLSYYGRKLKSKLYIYLFDFLTPNFLA